MTPELKKAIDEAMTMVAQDDLYSPYRPKRKTRATVAKEKGLQGLRTSSCSSSLTILLRRKPANT